MKRVLVGLTLAFVLGACGTASTSVDYSRLDAAMNQHPELVTGFCDARAQAAADGITDDRLFDFAEQYGAFADYPPDLGLTDRQIYDRIAGRC